MKNLRRKIRANIFHYPKDIPRPSLQAKPQVSAFWWDNVLNFGDLLTPDIISHFGCSALKSNTADTSIAGVGSILGKLNPDFSGVVFGSGLLLPKETRFERANYLSVRGELTKKYLGLDPSTLTGDLGLLAGRLYQAGEKKYSIGFVPHYVDYEHAYFNNIKQLYGPNVCLIDVQNYPARVAYQISQCNLIISSSLHGLIFADAMNIPNIRITIGEGLLGGDFKFFDYNSSIDKEQHAHLIKSLDHKLDVDKICVAVNEHKLREKVDTL